MKYEKMLKQIEDADIVLFGESHDNPISHWLQLELTKDLYNLKKDKLVLGAEMFESDNQVILNEYLEDKISLRSFESEARLWPNYKTDYKPLVEFAKTNNLTFVASNVPRRYASMVNSKGFEGPEELSDERTDQLRPFFRTWISVNGAIKSCGIPTNVHIAKVTVGAGTFAHRSEERIVTHALP